MKNKEFEYISKQKESKNAILKLDKIESNKSDDNLLLSIKLMNDKLLIDNEK